MYIFSDGQDNYQSVFVPNVIVAECLPISRQTLSNIVKSFARFSLDVASSVL